MICHVCGFENEEQSKFCANCGTSLPLVHKEPIEEDRSTEDLTAVVREVNKQIKHGPILNFDQPKEPVQPFKQEDNAPPIQSEPRIEEFEETKEPPIKENITNTSKEPARKKLVERLKSMPRKIGLAFAGALCLLILLLFSNRTKPINLNRYVTASVEGYEGYAHVTLEIDWESIQNDYGNKLRFTRRGTEVSQDISFLQDYITIETSSDVNQTYSNGDTISYSIVVKDGYQSYLKNPLEATEGTYTVNHLPGITYVDFFQDVTLTFHGVSGQGTVDVSYEGETNIHPSDFLVDHNANLSDGDTITVSISDPAVSKLLSQDGIIPTQTSQTYTVETLGSYLSSVGDIDTASLQMAVEDGNSAVFTEIDSSKDIDSEEILSVDYLGNLLLYTDEEKAAKRNVLFLVYAVTVRNFYGDFDETFTYYAYAKFENILIRTDGSLDYDVDAIETPTPTVHHETWYYWGYSTLEDLVNEAKEALGRSAYFLQENITEINSDTESAD